MGINDEYSRDAYVYELAYDSEGSIEDPEPLHPEDWQDWYSEELLDAWGRIREYSDSNYLRIKTTYAKFVEFVMYPTLIMMYDEPTMTESDLWALIAHIPLVRERVTEENFYIWARENINSNCNV
jgi:hypothetical protein